ncbi:MAG TPA: YwiC-like family protein, partial [Candidatus Binatia bacterium]|nr:YwiC-like family protein [Candidatus Binatia bacterium]
MHRWFRKSLLFPAEHGSWPWLLVPYLVGASIAGQWSPASGLVLLGGLSIFLLRQPATAWLRT